MNIFEYTPSLTWAKDLLGRSVELKRENLSNIHEMGVYVIFNSRGIVVKVGQGDIKNRLLEHLNNPKIMGYKEDGKLFVT